MEHLSRILDAALAARPERLAAQGSDGALTYAEFDRVADAGARQLRRLGINRDEPVVVSIANRARDLAGFLGVWRAGGVAVPIHVSTPAPVAATLTERCGARFIVDRGEVARPGPLRPPPPERALLKDAAFVVFTSGTTGEPKGAVLNHRGFAGKLAAIDSVVPFTEATRTLLVLQLTFSFGHWVSLLTLMRGGTLHLHEKFEPARMLAALAEHRLDRLGIVPTMMRAALPLLDGTTIARDGIPPLFMAGGEPMAASLSAAWRRALPTARLCDIYGLTETSTCDFYLAHEDQDRYAGTIGTPMPRVEYAIHDAEGRAAGAGQTGELAIKTPFIMAGYLDAPGLTAQAFRGDYFRTGDLVETTREGRVRLVGRIKELIYRSGNKISPLEVERAFLAHPDIAEALATAVPDERLGEAIHLMIVPKPGAEPEPDKLRAWAAERIERYKLPDAIHVAAAIPLGRTGKADRAALKTLLMGPLRR